MPTKQEQWPYFFRLTENLRAMQIDYDYRKTRKLLDPNWDGYTIPEGHDILADDVQLDEANLVTSNVRGSDLHRVVLDLDNGGEIHTKGRIFRRPSNELRLRSRLDIFSIRNWDLLSTLSNIGIADRMPQINQPTPHLDSEIVFTTPHDVALIPSTTEGHKHLIIKTDLKWDEYKNLLSTLEKCGFIERGYLKASLAKGYTGIRPPWIKKPENDPPGKKAASNAS